MKTNQFFLFIPGFPLPSQQLWQIDAIGGIWRHIGEDKTHWPFKINCSNNFFYIMFIIRTKISDRIFFRLNVASCPPAQEWPPPSFQPSWIHCKRMTKI